MGWIATQARPYEPVAEPAAPRRRDARLLICDLCENEQAGERANLVRVAAIAAAISSTLVGALYDGPFRVRQIRFGQV